MVINLYKLEKELKSLTSVASCNLTHNKLLQPKLTVVYSRYEPVKGKNNYNIEGVRIYGKMYIYPYGTVKYNNKVLPPTHDLRHLLKKVFERHYPRNISFSEALKYMKNGYKIARANWGGYWYIGEINISPKFSNFKDFFYSSKSAKCPTCIIAKLRNGHYAPAQAYQCDMLANDWKVVSKC